MTIGYVDYVIVSGWTKGWAHCETKIVKIPNDINHEEIFLDICEQVYGESLCGEKKKDEIFRTAWGKSYFKTPQEIKDIRKGLNKLRKIK